MSHVFISYSRNDREFAHQLIDNLNHANKDVWIDWEGIPLSAPNWWDEIKLGIENSDSFIFIMSPDSIASVPCNLEVDYAFELGKRIIPVMYKEIKETKEIFTKVALYKPDKPMQERLGDKTPIFIATNNWDRLSHINWIFFREIDDFDLAFSKLKDAIEMDLDYVKAHTLYLTRAQEWHLNERPTDLLLFGSEIDRAETWLAKAQKYATADDQDGKIDILNPLPLILQIDYIAQSRKQSRSRQRLARGTQISIGVLTITILVFATVITSLVISLQKKLADADATIVAQNTALALQSSNTVSPVETNVIVNSVTPEETPSNTTEGVESTPISASADLVGFGNQLSNIIGSDRTVFIGVSGLIFVLIGGLISLFVLQRRNNSLMAFISYRRENWSHAYLLHEQLKARGVKTVYDSEFQAGDWEVQIFEKIEKCKKLVVILADNNTLTSNWVVREIEYALELRKIIVPVLIDDLQMTDLEIPLHISVLSTQQAVKLLRDYPKAGIEKLIEYLKQ